MKTYTITCYDWETYCQNCGSDLLIGDKVTMDRDENTFCGIECVRMYGEYMRSRELHVRAA